MIDLRPAIVAILLTTSAHASDTRQWPGTTASGHEPSHVTIHEPTAPGAVASVTFHNTEVHMKDETFIIEWNGIAVTVHFDWQADDTASERITVDPPAGYAAVPRQVTVPEDGTATIHIFKWQGA